MWQRYAKASVYTYEVGDVESVGESAGGAVSRVIDPVWRGVGTCGGGKVVVVSVIDKGVPKHKERTRRICSRSCCGQCRRNNKQA